MKKILCLCLSLCMLLTASCAMAVGNSASFATATATPTFKISVIEAADGYSYDAFERSWSYHEAYVRRFNDARVVIGLQLDGEGSSATVPVQLYCWIRDSTNSSVLHTVTEISLMVGNDIYRFRNVLPLDTSSCVLLGPDSEELLRAMASVDTITVRLAWSTANIDIEIPASEYRTTLKVGASTLLAANALYACDLSEWQTLFDSMKYEKY